MMGQQLSSQAHTSINKLPEKVARHAALARESGFLTHEEFLARLAELNEIHSEVDLLVCFGSLSCCSTQDRFSLS
ncbi:RN141 protein, partial [Polypterus senegalus]|nr:RN141 protein [Polypterus senegalus]